jgi:Mn-dependent DtxR family transcriptional regulator
MDNNKYDMMTRFINITEAAKTLATQLGYMIMIDMQPMPGSRDIFASRGDGALGAVEAKNAVAAEPMSRTFSKVNAALTAAKAREVLDLTPSRSAEKRPSVKVGWPHRCLCRTGVDPVWDVLNVIATSKEVACPTTSEIRNRLKLADYNVRGLLSALTRRGCIKREGAGWVLAAKSYNPRSATFQQTNQEAIYELIAAAGTEGVLNSRIANHFKFSGQLVAANLRYLKQQKRIQLDTEWVFNGKSNVMRVRARALPKKSG